MIDENTRLAAIRHLNAWLTEHGMTGASTSVGDWTITPFEKALLFAPVGQARSNRLYFVLGSSVAAFSPAVTSFDEAYARVAGDAASARDTDR